MDGVERFMVLGIFAVIVAILSVAALNYGDDPAGATDGGAPAVVSLSSNSSVPPVVAPPREEADDPIARAEQARLNHTRRMQSLLEGGEATPTGQPGATGGPRRGVGGTRGAGRKGAPVGEPTDKVPGGGARIPLDEGPVIRPMKPAPAGPGAYTVTKGDTLWSIVRKLYGDGDTKRLVDEVLELNPTLDPAVMQPGQELVVPARASLPEGVVARTPQEQASAMGGKLYTVREGDSLETIASRHLGDRTRWMDIYRLNDERIDEPSRIYAGMTLLLPESD